LHFARLAAECDATFVIAPEFDDILVERCQLAEASGGRLIGPQPEAVALCADKRALARHLNQHAVSTIPTRLLDDVVAAGSIGKWEYPVIVKPRDGAGSLDVTLVRSFEELESIRETTSRHSALHKHVVQPFVKGRPISVSAIVETGQERIDVFPPGLQLLSDDDTYRYWGGRIPAEGVDPWPVRDLVCRAIRSVPGLHGYVGLDLIESSDEPGHFVVCEINSRLTTSYLGYRELTSDNLAERLLFPERASRPIVWNSGTVSFTPEGSCERVA
jgi:predicted ATP-grasp superfamily ATP-dependent carboligase